MTHFRPDRVGDQIRRGISDMLARGDLHDPGIGFITLTRVTMTPDLQIARVYYTMLGDERARTDTARALDRATPFVRRRVGEQLGLRRVPEFQFRFDDSVEHQDRIERILRDLHDHPPEPLFPDAAAPVTEDTAIDAGRTDDD